MPSQAWLFTGVSNGMGANDPNDVRCSLGIHSNPGFLGEIFQVPDDGFE